MICMEETCTNGRVACIETRTSREKSETIRKYRCQLCGVKFFTKEVFDRWPMNGEVLDEYRQESMAYARSHSPNNQHLYAD